LLYGSTILNKELQTPTVHRRQVRNFYEKGQMDSRHLPANERFLGVPVFIRIGHAMGFLGVFAINQIKNSKSLKALGIHTYAFSS